MSNQIAKLKIPGAVMLPDNSGWENRFQIRSESSSKLYTVAQSKSNGTWGCSCMGWIRHKHCKHLNRLLAQVGRLK